VVTTDAVGRQVTTAVPFYISNTLLKPLFDYSLSLGKIREDYGLKNFLMENLQVQPMPVMG
jgi:outer membrane usher protein